MVRGARLSRAGDQVGAPLARLDGVEAQDGDGQGHQHRPHDEPLQSEDLYASQERREGHQGGEVSAATDQTRAGIA